MILQNKMDWFFTTWAVLLDEMKNGVKDLRGLEQSPLIVSDGIWRCSLRPNNLPPCFQRVGDHMAYEFGPGNLQLTEVQVWVVPSEYQGWSTYHLNGDESINRGASFNDLPGSSWVVGVPLADLSKPNRGNLVIPRDAVPRVQKYFRENKNKLGENPLCDATKMFGTEPGRQILIKRGVFAFPFFMPYRVAPNRGDEKIVVFFHFGGTKLKALEAYLQASAALPSVCAGKDTKRGEA